MKKIIIAGGTGMVGGIVLQACLDSDEVGRVTSFVRKASGVQHPKLNEIIHKDFTDYSGLMDHFDQVDAAYFCIGVYTGQVPDAQFKEITVDFAAALGDAVKKGSEKATFCLLSGAGADSKEKSRVAFAKYKGMAENYLIRQKFAQLYIFRPAYIYPVEPRNEPNLMYRISRKLYPLLKNIYSAGVITSEELGQAIFKAGMYGAPKTILENVEIKAFLKK